MSSTKGKTLYFNEKSMDYVTFGKGKDPLVIIPGLGDGLQTVKGKAQLFSLSYRLLAKRYKIYVFSRINKLRQGYTTWDMAADVARSNGDTKPRYRLCYGDFTRWNDCPMASCRFSRKGSKAHFSRDHCKT